MKFTEVFFDFRMPFVLTLVISFVFFIGYTPQLEGSKIKSFETIACYGDPVKIEGLLENGKQKYNCIINKEK